MKRDDNSVLILSRPIREYFLVCPQHRPVEPFNIQREDIDGSFIHRTGVGILVGIRSFEYGLSPEGTLRAFLKLMLRWFIALMILTLVVAIPLVMAFHFLDVVAAYIESIAKHIFMAIVWIILSCLLIAGGIAAYIAFSDKK